MNSRSTHTPDSNRTARDAETSPRKGVTRRSLLRTAAATAPLIATLPNGAAMANASTYQCVVKNSNETPPNTQPNIDTDMFVRVKAKTWDSFIPGEGPTKFYNFSSLDGSDTNITVDTKGNRYNQSPPTSPEPAEIYLLVLYQPVDGDPMNGLYVENRIDPEISPFPSQCTVKTGLNGWTAPAPGAPAGAYCVYPIAQFGDGGNMGATHSCLASFT